MKALILSAGLGTRLRPLTETIPKPLVPLNGKPLLQYHLECLRKHGVTDILINTHYLHEKIEGFIEAIKGSFPECNIRTVFEEVLLGSAGTLIENQSFFDGEEDILIVYGDNLTTINYTNLLAYHREKGGLVTIASYYEKYPETKGIIQTEENGKIIQFIEKPQGDAIVSHDANAGIYIASRKLFSYLSSFEKRPLDFGYDIFPFLLQKNETMYVYHMDEFLLDIGTPESYTKAQELVTTLFRYEH